MIYGVLALSVLFLLGCAEVPAELHSPSVRVYTEIDGDREKFFFSLSAGVINEKSNTAYSGYDAVVQVKGTDLTVPVSFDVLFPFETGVIDTTVPLDETSLEQVLAAFGLSREELVRDGEVTSAFIEPELFTLTVNDAESRAIVELLRQGGASDEK